MGRHRTPLKLILVACLAATLLSLASPAVAGPIQQVFAFGDQMLDVGQTEWYLGALWKADQPPYGRLAPKKLPSGRFSDANITLDFITGYLGYPTQLFPSLRKPLVSKLGTSFACMGAGTSFSVNAGKTYSLERQLADFKAYVAKRKSNPNVKFDQALYIISVGQNEFINALLTRPIADAQKMLTSSSNLVARAVADIFTLTKSHKIIVIGPPPLGCLPIIRYGKGVNAAGKCHDPSNKIASQLNTAIKLKLANVRKQFAIKHLSQLNLYFTYYYKIFGRGYFKDFTGACCEGVTPSGRKFSCGKTVREGGVATNSTSCAKPYTKVWWDWYNPTSAACQRIAEDIWSGSTQYMTPENLSTFANA
eukprot:TRINITY_DN14640_c0_g1_i1.p1 TRINITY_DN14640_c0_g1~~TRINITY_DN14640_c0_g1_i1.p1  ORF type:complete len:364 (-),score=8.13 TRINITY_DN14640_c0_g1_i1:437-1528(-)